MNRFANKSAIVTGASRGIGQAIALAFAREGAHVIGIDIGDLADTQSRAQQAGAKFTAIAADFSRLTQPAARDLVAQSLKAAGRIDALVNNAGIIRRAPAVDYPETDWNALIQINLTAPFFMCQGVAKWWLTEGRAKAGTCDRLKIVNICSMLSFQGGILVPAYTASKSGIAGITKALANEWAKERINVNGIAPGYVSTENTRQIREDEKRNAAILERIPEGRWATPDDIASNVFYLCTPEADYVNGAVLNVDGGWLAR